MKLNDFSIRKNMILMIFMIFSVIYFGIDFWWVLASILLTFWHPFNINFRILGWSFCWWFWGLDFYRFWQKMTPKKGWWISPFPSLFATCVRTLLPFTLGKTYKCPKAWNLISFFPNRRTVLHTCTCNPGKTYKCAVTVFTMLTINMQKCSHFGSLLAPCWLHVGRFEYQKVSMYSAFVCADWGVHVFCVF